MTPDRDTWLAFYEAVMEYNSWFFKGWQAPLHQYGYFTDRLRNACTLWELEALAEYAQLPTYFYVRPVCWTAAVTMEDGAVEYLSWLIGQPQRWVTTWPQNPDLQRAVFNTWKTGETPMKTREEKVAAIQNILENYIPHARRSLSFEILDAIEPLPKPPRKIRVWAVVNSNGEIQEVRSPDSTPELSQRAWPSDHRLVNYAATLVDED